MDSNSSTTVAVADLTEARMYRALLQRDESFIGAFVVGVKTTGVFCRPGCGAKAPRREHCEYFEQPAAALRAGYRPCKRCRPLDAGPAAPRWAQSLLKQMLHHPARLLTAADARSAGVHPATAARYFKRRLGGTFQSLSRAARVGAALQAIRTGSPVGGAGRRAGFSSESGFRKAVMDLFGATPPEAARAGLRPLACQVLATPLGPMIAVADDEGICLLEFLDRRMLATNLRAVRSRLHRPIAIGNHVHLAQLERELRAYFDARLMRFATPLHMAGTPFQRRVWSELLLIPAGQTRSYRDVAGAMDAPGAVRAVARANGRNPIAILVPCHRVIAADGSLCGYGGGVWRKQRLLELESRMAAMRKG